MRVFLMLLIFAIGFGGYSAAAHAFADVSCNSVTMSHDTAGMTDCPEGQAETSKADNSNGTASKGACLDCTHCCASHALGLSAYSHSFPPQASILNPLTEAVHHSDLLFSLLRPPKKTV